MIGEVLLTGVAVALSVTLIIVQIPWELWAKNPATIAMMDVTWFVTTGWFAAEIGGQTLAIGVLIGGIFTSITLRVLSAAYRRRNS